MAEIWGAAIAVVGGGILSGMAQNQAQDDANKQSDKNSELGFQRQAWLDQQQRKWTLEDRQYKEDSIAGFRGFSPESAKTFNGVAAPIPTRTSTDGLDDFNPNQRNSLLASAG